MSSVTSRARLLAWWLAAVAAPVGAASIDLSQLCGSGDCVVSTNTTIVSASAPLSVGGNFTVNPGVVLEFRVPIRIDVAGNLILSGTVGAPGDGGSGGPGGDAGQVGYAGGNAPAVASGVFNAQGTITLNANANAVAEGGTGGSGGSPGFGQTVGGAGGAGGAAGSLTFNTCSTFTSAASARILVNGGPGGVGQAGALGGAGGAGGAVTLNAKQSIVSNAPISALGGAGGSGGSGSGASGASGTITLSAVGAITVAAGTLSSGTNTPSVNSSQATLSALAFCVASTPAAPIPTLSAGAMLLLASLLALISVRRWRGQSRFRARPKVGA